MQDLFDRVAGQSRLLCVGEGLFLALLHQSAFFSLLP
jgi:hypothetical protein